MTPEEMKQALKLAGKLAIHARLVVDATAKNLSQKIADMENALDEYDIEIFKKAKKYDTKLISS